MAQAQIDIQVEDLKQLRDSGADFAVLDVREGWELEICALPGAVHIPLGELPGRANELPKVGKLVVMCHRGGRSLRATQWLRANGISHAVNLAGGITAWAERVDPGMAVY